MFAGNFAPVGWELCQGQLLSIADYDVLFNLIGTTYGGDGQETFAVPDLRGRIPLHQGTGLGVPYVLGEMGGAETVTLTANQIPSHNHPALANTSGSTNNPAGNTWAGWTGDQYSDQGPNNPMAAGALQTVGGSQPHDNMPPYLTVNFIISLFGIYPSQT